MIMKRRIKEQSSVFAHSNFKSSKDGGRSPFEKDSLPLGLDTALDDDFTEEEWAAFDAQLDQRLSQPRKPLSPGAQELQDKMDQAEWEFGMRESKSVKITKKQLQEMIREGVKKALVSEQNEYGTRSVELDDNEWRELATSIQNARSKAMDYESLAKTLMKLSEFTDPMAARALLMTSRRLLEPADIAVLERIAKK